MYLDFHTHSRLSYPNVTKIFNLIVEDTTSEEKIKDSQTPLSLGIHPWYFNEGNVEYQLGLLKKYAKNEQVKIIGEAGLDKLRGADFELQKYAFSQQIDIAETLKKPMVIHCVRAFNEILEIKKQENPKQVWVIHGFNRKADLAQSLLNEGLYLSFGIEFLNKEHIQEAFISTPLENIFLETDDEDAIPISVLYEKAAVLKGISTNYLAEKINNNYQEIVG